MDKNKVFDVIDSDWEAHLERYKRYIRQPSVSNTSEGVLDMANLLVKEFKDLGCQEAYLCETGGWPVVYGSIDVGAPKTILLYGMYDVQPVEGEIWKSPPYEANIVDDEEFGKVIMGRGARNQKGPLAAVMNAVKSIMDAEGTLPVNIKFLIEGEEEMGSAHLQEAIIKLKSELETCDCIFFHAFDAQPHENKVKLYLGVKGITQIEINFKGGDWGGPAERHIHAEHAVWVNSPIWEFIKAFATIKDENDRIMIDGFYDEVVGLLDGDDILIDNLDKTWDVEGWKKSLGIRKFKNNMTTKQALEIYSSQPELNIDGIFGGYTGEGLKTLLPHDVTVKMDLRTVPNMSVERTMDCIKKHFEKIGIMDKIEMKYHNAYGFMRAKLAEPCIQAMISAQEEMGYVVQPWPCLGGSDPSGLFQEIIDIPIISTGLGYAALSHSPNEFAVVDTLKDSEKCCVLFMQKFSEL